MSVTSHVDSVSMGSSDVAVRNEDDVDGYTNKCLDINEFSVAATNRELVNLENAAVNIDNSSDVIIGPVTQFNVNGNVTIYQNKDGLPIGIKQNDDDLDNVCNTNYKDIEANQQESIEHKRCSSIKYSKWICFLIVATLGILTSVKLTVKSLQHDVQEIVVHLANKNMNVFGTQDWGGVMVNMAGLKTQLHVPVPFIIIKHTGGAFCQTESECKQLTKELQSKHLALNYSDIAYNFLVGGDGNLYVGRGFAYPNKYSRFSYDIAVHGNFLYDQFYDYMENVTRYIIEYGVFVGFIDQYYVILCENQTEKVDSPGRNIYEKVKLWDHYRNYTFLNTQFPT